MNEYIFDIEANGLNPDKIHVVSVSHNGQITSTANYEKLKEFFSRDDITLIGHNIMRYDIPVIERLLGITVKARLIDTLALSWYLEFDRKKHGLELWGEEFGVPKPKIEDWDSLTYEEYRHRCEEDVYINTLLWERLKKKLDTLYEDKKDLDRCVNYLTFKLKCAALQEKGRWKLDVPFAKKKLQEMEDEKQEKIIALKEAMPRVPIIKKKTKPKKPFKEDQTESRYGKIWFRTLAEQGLPRNYNGVVEVVDGYKEPNPNSVPQIKDWLYSLGWKPQTFKFQRNKETNEVKEIPQINLPDGDGVCPSIKALYKKEPSLEVLDGLSILSHRIAILKGFLSAEEDGYVKAEVQGLTNTLRFKHAVCVNLPGVGAAYGDVIRGCLIAPEGYELCGSDMSSLEDRTKQHYMWNFDKAYVKEMMVDGFDPHLDLAVSAGALTREQANEKGAKDKYREIRSIYKAANYACVYGAGGTTVARSAGISKKEGDELVESYWKRNWSVKAIPNLIRTKVEFGSMWLLNPVSKLWYSLRTEKDIFSTLNQGTGVWCFDMWVTFILLKRPQLTAQFHDEVVLTVKKGHREEITALLKESIANVNKRLKLNRDLDVDVQFGDKYSEIH